MAGIDKKLTDLTELASPTDNAWIHVVEPTDISQSPEGSSFKVKKSNFGGLSDAPSDGETYGRKDGAWEIVSGNVLTTNTNITSSSLTTQDVAGFVSYINSLLISFEVLPNEIRTYTVTDTGQIFELLLRGRSFGGSEPDITTSDVIDFKNNTQDLFNVFNGRYRVSAIVPIAKGLTTTSLMIMDANWVVTGTLATYTNSNFLDCIINNDSAAGAGSTAGQTLSNLGRIRTPDFIYTFEYMANDLSTVANARAFIGFTNSATLIGNVNPSTVLNCVGVGYDTGETTLSVMHNDGSGVCTKVNLGSDYPSNTSGVDLYRISIYYNFYSGKYYVKTERYNTSRVKLFENITEITTNFPLAANMPFFPQIWRNNGGTALAVRYAFGKFYMGKI